MFNTHVHADPDSVFIGNSANRLRKLDPTKTLMLRKKFESELVSRFKALRKVIIKSVDTNDCFGLKNPAPKVFAEIPLEEIIEKQYVFEKDSKKIDLFMEWLKKNIEKGILEIGTMPQLGSAIEKQWTDLYIKTAYQKGITNARTNLSKAGYKVPGLNEPFYSLSATFQAPFHMDRVGVLYTRAFTSLKGITDEMGKQISNTLAQGMMEGQHPSVIAKRLAGNVDNIGINRAKTLARTEIIRAHHVATIQEYENFGIENVTVLAEWQTAGFKVCPKCQQMAGRDNGHGKGVYTLDQIRGLIPLHPNCRCATLPVDITDRPVQQTVPKAIPKENVKAASKKKVVTKGPKKVKSPVIPKEIPAVSPIPTTPPISIPTSDPVASFFRNSEDSISYLSKKAEYKSILSAFGIDKPFMDGTKVVHTERQRVLRELVDTKFPDVYTMLFHWQGSTHSPEAMAFRRMCSELEDWADPKKHLWKRPGVREAVLDRDNFKKMVPKEQYIGFRALNQAYMESIGETKYTLYRGTDGKTGELIAESVREKQAAGLSNFSFENRQVAGYSTSKQYADGFGKSQKGITVTQEFTRDQVIVHKDLMSGLTGRNVDELEFIMKDEKLKTVDMINVDL